MELGFLLHVSKIPRACFHWAWSSTSLYCIYIILTQFCKNLANRRVLTESFILHFPEHIGCSHGYVICPDITQDKNSIFTKSHTVGADSMYYNKI